MESHFININIFDINKLKFTKSKNISNQYNIYYNYSNDDYNKFNLLINIKDYYIYNNVLFFNLKNNEIIELLLKNIINKLNDNKDKDFCNPFKRGHDVDDSDDNEDENEYIKCQKIYKYNINISNNILIFKLKNKNINLNQNKKDILNNLNNNKNIINIGISFDHVFYNFPCFYFDIKLSFIEIKEPLNIIYLYNSNKTKKITITNNKLKNIDIIKNDKKEEEEEIFDWN